jgi:acyl-CoA reductase-like NAD-dependent aldehyde dehydrogenase
VAADIKHYAMFINGKHVDSDEIDEIPDPATEELAATIARGGVEQADQAVAAARKAFDSGSWSRMEPADRSAVMTKPDSTDRLCGGGLSC